MIWRRLLAVDPSLTCSGWALFRVKNDELLGVGKLKSLAPELPLATRLLDLQKKINRTFDKLEVSDNDVLVCEAPTTMRDPGAAFKVEQVRGIFEAVARERGMSVPGRINPRSVHHEIMGLKGKQMKRDLIKRTALCVVNALHTDALTRIGFDCAAANLKRNQDIIDAILLGSLGLSWLRAALLGGHSLENFFDHDRKRSKRRAVA